MTSNASSAGRDSGAPVGPRNRTLAIFLVSVLSLFLELMLIRWIGTEIRIFAYLQNTVLIVCFLGLGMGCFTCRRKVQIRNVVWPLLLLVGIMAFPFTRRAFARITDLLSVLSDLLIWENAINTGLWVSVGNVTLGLALTLVMMILLWEVFVPLGRILGRLMDDHPRTVWAYSVNVAGSLAGIWLFVLLSAFYLPPIVWLLVAAAMLVFYLEAGQRRLDLALIGALVACGWFASREAESLQVAWSPYQKLVLRETHADDPENRWKGQFLINVNNVGYQGIVDLSPSGIAANPEITADMEGLSQYDIPLRFHPNPRRVLIVGAGSGNDVAGALRGGASEVTAVDIDPAIIAMGRRYHAERPYESPQVTIVNDDARSFFATTDKQFDVIIFGLLDSHTTTSMTNARLDHYVYTKESLSRARSLLADGGVMSLTFMAHRQYIADRLGGTLKEVFGQPPLAFTIPSTGSGWGGVMFLAGDQQKIGGTLAADPVLADRIDLWQNVAPIALTYSTALATDDWPYIYLEEARIPTLYYLLAALLVVLVVYARKRLDEPKLTGGWRRTHWHFFFLGAAFLLLEVQNISKASVVLGNTWIVNAVIISGILVMILAANYLATRLPKLPQSIVASCLIGSCLAMYFVDVSQFAFLPYASKAVLVGLLTTLPMLFSGVLFIRSFAVVEHKDAALGANLIGALVGGLLQSVTFIVGIKALLLIVAALYTAAVLTGPRQIASREEAPRDLDDEDTAVEDYQDDANPDESELVAV